MELKLHMEIIILILTVLGRCPAKFGSNTRLVGPSKGSRPGRSGRIWFRIGFEFVFAAFSGRSAAEDGSRNQLETNTNPNRNQIWPASPDLELLEAR